jgi:chromosome segregation ATPase
LFDGFRKSNKLRLEVRNVNQSLQQALMAESRAEAALENCEREMDNLRQKQRDLEEAMRKDAKLWKQQKLENEQKCAALDKERSDAREKAKEEAAKVASLKRKQEEQAEQKKKMKEEEERVQRSIREKRNNSTCTLF